MKWSKTRIGACRECLLGLLRGPLWILGVQLTTVCNLVVGRYRVILIKPMMIIVTYKYERKCVCECTCTRHLSLEIDGHDSCNEIIKVILSYIVRAISIFMISFFFFNNINLREFERWIELCSLKVSLLLQIVASHLTKLKLDITSLKQLLSW